MASGEIPAIEGTLVALSHTFKIRGEILFLAEFCCRGNTHYVIVRREIQLSWHLILQIGIRFRITILTPGILYKDKHDITVLHLSRHSQLIHLEDDQDDGVSALTVDSSLISCKGVITAVVDEEAGVYELDSKTRLVISYLLDLTGELWNNHEVDGLIETVALSKDSCRKTEVNKLYKCFDVGDCVTVYLAHHFEIAGIQHIVCCGRSLVKKNGPSPIDPRFRKCPSSVVDVVHIYNPGISGLTWLLDLQRCLITTLCPGVVDEKHIKRRQWNGNNGLLINLIHEAAKRKFMETRTRSLYQEFLLSHHKCVVTQESVPPFTLVTMASLRTSVNDEDHIENEREKLWCHAVAHESERRVLVGKLQLCKNGVLQVHHQNSKVDLVVVGNKEYLFNMLGAVVAIFKFDHVVEKFNIINKGSMENLHKKYIITKSSDVVVLIQPLNVVREIAVVKRFLEVTIISKSGLVFNHHYITKDSQNLSYDMFFIAHSIIKYKDFHTDSEKKWNRFVKFFGENALFHSCIQDGYCCILQIPDSMNVELMMKSHANAWLGSLNSYFGTCECVYLPVGSSLMTVVPGKQHQSDISVMQISNPMFEASGLVTVIGLIKDRQHMSSKFNSEQRLHPSGMYSDYHIGIPGNKIIRILLEDRENPDSTIWLYFSSSSNNFAPHYPLGIVPGVTITASDVLRNTSKQNKIMYLKSTAFTCLTPVSQPNPIHPIMKIPKFYYLQEISKCHEAFKCFASVGQIQKVTISTICNFCSSEMAMGSCTYIGCHAKSSAKMTASAQVVIDDGTAAATVFMNSVEQVQTLLQLTVEQCTSFNQHVVSGCHQLTYSRKRESGLCYSLKNDNSGISLIFEKICSSHKLLRPFAFSCRVSSQSPRKSQSIDHVHLYCLSLSEIKPNIDFEILAR